MVAVVHLVYDFDIVGGAYDGAPALAWIDDGKHPCPPAIYVGVCGVGMDCGTSKCKPGASHISYWLPDEAGRPTTAKPYRKQEEFVERDDAGELHGRAVYAVGGLLDPSNFGEKARVPAGFEVPGFPTEFASTRSRELLPAGRHDQGWPRGAR